MKSTIAVRALARLLVHSIRSRKTVIKENALHFEMKI